MQIQTFADGVCVCGLLKFYPDVRFSKTQLNCIKHTFNYPFKKLKVEKLNKFREIPVKRF